MHMHISGILIESMSSDICTELMLLTKNKKLRYHMKIIVGQRVGE